MKRPGDGVRDFRTSGHFELSDSMIVFRCVDDEETSLRAIA